jgi:hypothetical protein
MQALYHSKTPKKLAKCMMPTVKNLRVKGANQSQANGIIFSLLTLLLFELAQLLGLLVTLHALMLANTTKMKAWYLLLNLQITV